MEEVLDFYQWPYDPHVPLVCIDEKSKQVLADTRAALSVQPGQILRQDFEYERQGTCNLFIAFEPLRSWRQVQVTAQRTAVDWAHFMKQLAEVHYPDAERIHVVMDNLNTHQASSFYEAFAPAEARRLALRFEFHYTPKHGSWLNMAKIELSVLDQMCLDQRFANGEQMAGEVATWQDERNALEATLNWRFTTDDARIKLHKRYPSIFV
jgi:DDE superfamily endonuclease